MSKVPGYAKKVGCLFLILLLLGCANRQTFEESKYHFFEPRSVLKHQSDWVMPGVLEIYKVSGRQEICRICNNLAAGGKGSHFNIFGLHKSTIQDRGCYITDDKFLVGRAYYLAGDQEARLHEVAHHYHGPRHEKPRPWLRWRHLNTGGSSYSVAVTGTRIRKAWKD